MSDEHDSPTSDLPPEWDWPIGRLLEAIRGDTPIALMAERTGKSRSAIYSAERQKEPQWSTIVRHCTAAGVGPAEFCHLLLKVAGQELYSLEGASINERVAELLLGASRLQAEAADLLRSGKPRDED